MTFQKVAVDYVGTLTVNIQKIFAVFLCKGDICCSFFSFFVSC